MFKLGIENISYKWFLFFVFFNNSFCIAFGQHRIPIIFEHVTIEEDIEYSKQFKIYTLISIPTKIVSDLLRTQDFFESIEISTPNGDIEFNLHAKDIRSANFELRVQDQNEIRTLPRFPNST